MVLVKVGLKQQRGITIALVGVVLLLSIERILMMQRTRENQGNIRAVFRVEDISILRESLVAFVGDVDKVRVIVVFMMYNLSAFAMLFKSLYRCLEDIVITDLRPTVHQ